MKTELPVIEISQKIYCIRGRQVMLDSDLASLYGVKTKVLNQTARRNQKRLSGEDFLFQLIEDEYNSLRSQFVTLENDKSSLKSNTSLLEGPLRSQIVTLETRKGNHRKFLPTVYTEYGAVMLSGLLNSDRAIEINLAVVKAFVEFRRRSNARAPLAEKIDDLEKKIEQLFRNSENQFQLVLHSIQQLRRDGLNTLSQHSLSIQSSMNLPKKKRADPTVFSKRIFRVVETIQQRVAQYYGIKERDLKSASRVRAISLPRQIAIYLIRKNTDLGFKDIGKIFQGKDHTTAIHAFKKVKTAMDRDESIRESVTRIEEDLQKKD